MAVAYRIFALAFIVLAVACFAASRYPAAMQVLDKTDPGVAWDTKGAVTADVTCDGKLDLVIIGQKGSMGVVAVVPGVDKPGKPIIGEFPTGHPQTQDGFCGKRLKLYLEPRDCLWEDGRIEGCKVVKGCKAFRVDDGDCDAFHFYWDNKAKQLTYNRL